MDLSEDALLVEQALGVLWCIESYSFKFRINVTEKTVTIRGILFTVCSIYNPLEFFAPFTLSAKLLIAAVDQRETYLGRARSRLAQQWFVWLSDFNQLSTFAVSRCKREWIWDCIISD